MCGNSGGMGRGDGLRTIKRRRSRRQKGSHWKGHILTVVKPFRLFTGWNIFGNRITLGNY